MHSAFCCCCLFVLGIERKWKPKLLFQTRKQFHKQVNQLYTYSNKEWICNRSGHYVNYQWILQIIPVLDMWNSAQKYFQLACHFTLRSDLKGKRKLSTQIPLKAWTELLIWVSNSYWLGVDDGTFKILWRSCLPCFQSSFVKKRNDLKDFVFLSFKWY